MSSFPNAVVLTGGIATGKSTAGAIIKELGFELIDADLISKEIFADQSVKIEKIFDTLDRTKIAQIVFADQRKKAELEKLLHPLIRERILQKATILEGSKKLYFVDIPLFFETKNYPFDKILLIYAPKEIQLDRMIKERNYTEQEARARLNAQMDIESKKLLANWVISNTNSKAELKTAIKNLLSDQKKFQNL